MEREDLITVLERHGTDGALGAATALRAGAAFQVWSGSSAPARQLFAIWEWRAQWMAEDGVVTVKDFEQGLPALRRAGATPVALAKVKMTGDSHLVFLTTDLSACVAVL
ncbi:hypothetical protein [Kitasatospora sp. NPDC059827]|uniref:hypothetical protein n=1 Tax=Kitasatospora sp. NPDC059827 TaxID=3346964 RepID=UPI00364FF24F